MAVRYEYYRCFYYAAKYQNLTQAAAALQTSQPNMTRILRSLERELGCRLMLRSNRGVTLTEEGERLYAHVAAAFEELRLGEELFAPGGALRGGSVHVGASASALHGFLLPVLGRFHRAYPEVRLKIRNSSAPQALHALRRGQIDFAVVTMAEEPLQPPFRRTDLTSLRDVLIAAPSLVPPDRGPLALEELERYPLISLSRSTATFAFYSALYRRRGLVFDPDMEVDTADLLLPMVEHGLGVGFLPESFARPALAAGTVAALPLAEPIPPRSICLVQDTRTSLTAPARLLRQTLLESAGA